MSVKELDEGNKDEEEKTEETENENKDKMNLKDITYPVRGSVPLEVAFLYGIQVRM